MEAYTYRTIKIKEEVAKRMKIFAEKEGYAVCRMMGQLSEQRFADIEQENGLDENYYNGGKDE